ncbi:MAG: cation diffusion facilitator family transporter [Pseudomonadota bacterium]
MNSTESFRQAKKITLMGAAVNIFLAILKTVTGWLGDSQALFADGIHSFSDLLTDILVLYAAKTGSHGPDYNHPYGHQRIETALTIVVGIVLTLAGFGIIADAIVDAVLHHDVLSPNLFVLMVAVISIVTKEFMYRYTLNVSERIGSMLLKTNAWHHRSDALSSLVVLISATGEYFGIHYLDAVGAMIIGAMILRMAGKSIWSCVRELVDTGIDGRELQFMHDEMLKVPGIKSIHQLRTRFLGGTIFVDVHIQVDSHVSVSEGHYIAEQIIAYLSTRMNKVADVTVHVDTTSEETAPSKLPNRIVVEEQLRACWKDLSSHHLIDHINLHYLNESIEVEVFLPLRALSALPSAEELLTQYQTAVKKIPFISKIQVFFFY